MSVVKAGAVVVSAADPERILVLYRAAYKDWSFPKGHVDPGESAIQAMHREVREESGLGVEVICDLAPLRYVDALGTDSFLEMWLVRSTDDAKVKPEHKGDKLRWVTLKEAADTLTHASLADWFSRQHGAIVSHVRGGSMKSRP